jgi:high-affinity iron transporter
LTATAPGYFIEIDSQYSMRGVSAEGCVRTKRSGASHGRGTRQGNGILALAVAATLLLAVTTARAENRDDVVRVYTLLNLVGEEFRESVRGDESLRDREYEEARGFFREALQRWQRLAGEIGRDADVERLFERAEALLTERQDPDAFRATVEALQTRLAERTGVAPEVFPPEAPSLDRGQRIFEAQCSGCHGVAGDGRGPQGAALSPPPSDFTDAEFMAGVTPFDFFHVITAGRLTAGMPGWDEALSLQERWDVVAYLWSIPRQDHTRGGALYAQACVGCHGEAGESGPRELRSVASLARSSDGEIAAALRTSGVHEHALPAGVRDEGDALRDLVAYIRRLGTAEGSGQDEVHALTRARDLLKRAVELHDAGDRAAGDVALDAYLAYEVVEKRALLVIPELGRSVERGFVELRGLLGRSGPAADVRSLATRLDREMEAVGRALLPAQGRLPLLLQSATIILREGFEALIVIAALAAYLRRSGHDGLRALVYGGALAGLVASGITAWMFFRVLGLGVVAQELLEGATMLLAAVVLFGVSYWLISRAEADRWQRFIRGRVDAALNRGSRWSLAGTAFLAVYREGVETVLFYQALWGVAKGAEEAVIAGMVVGLGGLAIVYGATTALGLRVPMRAFFLGTGGVLYLMAFSFAGSGVRELQEAGLVPTTAFDAWPSIGWLGMSPTREVALVQGAFLIAAVVAAAVGVLRWRAAGARETGQRPPSGDREARRPAA